MQFTDWSNAVHPERSLIVFENRNREYGAYALRRDYQKRLVLSLFLATTPFAILSVWCLIKFHNSDIPVASPVIDDRIVIDYFDNNISQPPAISTPPTRPSASVSNPQIETVPQIVTQVDPTPSTGSVDDHGTITDPTVTATGTGTGTVSVENPSSGFVTEVPVEPPTWVEVMPAFPGGEEALFKYLSNNLRFTPEAKRAGVSGRVFLSFVVNPDGKVVDVKIIKGLGYGLDEEAVRVVSNMPQWSSGIQSGRKVSVLFRLPITFNFR